MKHGSPGRPSKRCHKTDGCRGGWETLFSPDSEFQTWGLVLFHKLSMSRPLNYIGMLRESRASVCSALSITITGKTDDKC